MSQVHTRLSAGGSKIRFRVARRSWETGLLSRKRERICWGTEGSTRKRILPLARPCRFTERSGNRKFESVPLQQPRPPREMTGDHRTEVVRVSKRDQPTERRARGGPLGSRITRTSEPNGGNRNGQVPFEQGNRMPRICSIPCRAPHGQICGGYIKPAMCVSRRAGLGRIGPYRDGRRKSGSHRTPRWREISEPRGPTSRDICSRSEDRRVGRSVHPPDWRRCRQPAHENLSSSAFASIRSAVSKPSVNQP
jgi:hypothetical protein